MGASPKDGIARVEVRSAAAPTRRSTASCATTSRKVKPGFPDNPKVGFAFEGDFADLAPMRYDVNVVAIAKNGRET